MYRFIHENDVIATLNSPTWVVLMDNGYFGLCEEEKASGVVINGTVYHLLGRDDIPQTDSVSILKITESEYQSEIKERQLETESAIAELSILVAEMK